MKDRFTMKSQRMNRRNYQRLIKQDKYKVVINEKPFYIKNMDFDISIVKQLNSTPEQLSQLKKQDNYEGNEEYYSVIYLNKEKYNLDKDITNVEYQYGDWWRLIDVNKKRLFYLIISSPYIISENKYGIKDFLYQIFDNQFKTTSEFKFVRIKDDKPKRNQYYTMKSFPETSTYDIINYYEFKNLIDIEKCMKYIHMFNEIQLNIKEVLIERTHKHNSHDIHIYIPFGCTKTYFEIFKDILDNKIKNTYNLNNKVGENKIIEFIETHNLKFQDFIKIA